MNPLSGWQTHALACTICLGSLQGAEPGSTGQQAIAPAKAQKSAKILYKRYAITDEQGFKDMEIVRGVLPNDWTWKGGVSWRRDLAQPYLLRVHWGGPQDTRAFDVYPYMSFAWSSDAERGVYQPGQVVLFNIAARPPADVFEAFEKVVIQLYRPDLAQAKIISKERMPEVAKKIYEQVNTDPNNGVLIAAGKETFEYELHGQTVQEVLSGVLQESRYKINNPKAVTYWSLSCASSQRAPKGQLAQLDSLRAVMVQSLEFNPLWRQKVAEFVEARRQRFFAAQRAQLGRQKAQFDATEARIGAQTSANDAQHQAYWQHSANLAVESENRADVMREVSPWKTSDGSTYKLPTQYGQAWSSANGEILMNNEPGYNPNSDPTLTPTQWTPMEPTHN